MATRYVIGLLMTGGCWLASETMYPTFEQAEKMLDAWRRDGDKAYKVFTLYDESEATTQEKIDRIDERLNKKAK